MIGAVIDPRSIPVRFSRLKKIAQSPAHYFASVQEGDDNVKESLAMRLGSGVHAILFSQPVTVFEGERRGHAWARFKKDHEGVEILTTAEARRAEGIVKSLTSSELAFGLLARPGAVVEKRIDWTFMGRAWRSTPDVRHTALVDLKTGRTSEPERFLRSAEWYGYDAQLATYGLAMEAAGFGLPEDYFIIAVETVAPYPVTVIRLSERTIENGLRKMRLWMERLLACEAANEWPAYCQSVVDWDIPEHDGEFKLTIDGEEMEVA